jgi:chromosome segregation ATPase
VTERLLDVVRDLEAQDALLAHEIDQVEELRRRAAAVGAAATRIARFLEELPAERTGLEQKLVHLERELGERELARDTAERELERAGEKEQSAARRAAVRARDAVSVTKRELEQASARLRTLEVEAKAAIEELARLRRESVKLTTGIRDAPAISRGTVPDPGGLAEDLVEWASRARAALLLSRSGLETQRERVVREAYELAAVTLGEVGATSVAGVVERLARMHGA